MQVASIVEATELGKSGIQVSRVGFGGCPMGGHGWGQVQSDELLDAIAFALDHGITFFDTADVYGLGQSETMLGMVLRGRRDQAIVATKFGVRIENGKTSYDNSTEWLRTALDASLKRLRSDYIDLYQLHYWDGRTDLTEISDALEDARERGKIRAWGVTNIPVASLGMRPSRCPVSLSYEYSLACRDHEDEVLRSVEQQGATFLSWGSLGQGILTGKYDIAHKFESNDRRSRSTYANFTSEGRHRNLRIVEVLRALKGANGSRSLTQIALRWILDRIPGSVALVGIKRREQIKDAMGALGWRLSRDEIDRLDAISRTSFGGRR